MKYNLLLTSRRRIHWLLGGLLAGVVVCCVLAALGRWPVFELLLALPVLLLVLLPFWDKLFRQSGWVQLMADGVAWANPAAAPPCNWTFAEVQGYRFVPSRNGIALRLRLRTGELAHLEGSLTKEFIALWTAFDQAVKRYNQAHPGAEVGREKDALEKFFTKSASTKVLWALLALAAAWLGWGIAHGWPGVAYLPLLLVGLPYLLVWANFYYERR